MVLFSREEESVVDDPRHMQTLGTHLPNTLCINLVTRLQEKI